MKNHSKYDIDLDLWPWPWKVHQGQIFLDSLIKEN